MPIKGSETSWIWFPCGHQKMDLKSRIFIVHGCKCIDRHHPIARVTSVLVWWFKLVSGVSNAKVKYNKIKHFLRLGCICFNSAKPMQDGSYIPWYYLRKASRACSTTSFQQIPEFNKVYTHIICREILEMFKWSVSLCLSRNNRAYNIYRWLYDPYSPAQFYFRLILIHVIYILYIIAMFRNN